MSMIEFVRKRERQCVCGVSQFLASYFEQNTYVNMVVLAHACVCQPPIVVCVRVNLWRGVFPDDLCRHVCAVRLYRSMCTHMGDV